MKNPVKFKYGIMLGGNSNCFIMLDAGVNHNNDLNRAKELIRTAKVGGASAIKFQTYSAEEISTKKAPRYWDSKLDTDGGGSQYDMFKKVDNLPKKAYYEMKEYAKDFKILFSSSPFGMESAKFLKKLDIDFYKIASAEMTNHQMMEFVAEIGKPIILSTGACTIGEIEEALDIVSKAKNKQIVLQHCVLSYPCRNRDANLAKMIRLQQLFPDIPVGYSDHTYGSEACFAAVALGAKSIEKHYSIDSSLPDSPDHKFSLVAEELKGFVDSCAKVQESIGKYDRKHYLAEDKAHRYARKSIVAVKQIKKGEIITVDSLSYKRPGTGIYPKFVGLIQGRKARVDINEDDIISWSMIA